MKYIPVLLLPVLMIACRKAANVSPANTGSTITKTSDSSVSTPVQLPATVTYPYTDEYVGSMRLTYGSYPPFDSTDKSYTFYVIHTDPGTMIVRSTGPLALEGYAATSIYINDTISAGWLRGKIRLFTYDKRQDVDTGALVVSFSGGQMVLSWDLPYVPMLGACDFGESTGQFKGTQKARR